MRIGIVILAAGNSKRYGANKLLECINEKKMYQSILDKVDTLTKKNDFISAIVVTQYKEIYEYAQLKNMSVIINEHPEYGISYSIRLGLQQCMSADATMFTVSDQPWLSYSTLVQLIELYLQNPEKIVCTSYKGETGNPCIFPQRYYSDLMNLKKDVGGKKIIVENLFSVKFLEIKDKKELQDIDTPEQAQE